MITSENYAARAADFFAAHGADEGSLYSPVARLALELERVVRTHADESQVLAVVALLLRHLFAPGVIFGEAGPQPDHAKLERLWTLGTQRGRYLASLRELQMLAASYVGVAATLSADPELREAKLARMSREAEVMLEHLDVIVGHYGHRLGGVAELDLGGGGGEVGHAA